MKRTVNKQRKVRVVLEGGDEVVAFVIRKSRDHTRLVPYAKNQKKVKVDELSGTFKVPTTSVKVYSDDERADLMAEADALIEDHQDQRWPKRGLVKPRV